MKAQFRSSKFPQQGIIFLQKKRRRIIHLTKEAFSVIASLSISVIFLTLAFLGPSRKETQSFIAATPTYASETPVASLAAYLPLTTIEQQQKGDKIDNSSNHSEEQPVAAPATIPAVSEPIITTSSPSFILPLRSYTGISTSFSFWHQAVDLTSPSGTPVLASADGVVTTAGWVNNGYGQLVTILHGGGFTSLYAHLATIGVSTGKSVKQGDVIGGVGCTGNCTGNHLHYALSQNGQAFNPL